MKKFRFTMEKVLDYNTHIQKNEKQTLALMRIKLALLCEKKDRLTEKRRCLLEDLAGKCEKGLSAREIASFMAYMNELQSQIASEEKKISDLNIQIDRQIKKLVKANREKRSMEILRDRQLVSYEKASRKETERQIEEFVARV